MDERPWWHPSRDGEWDEPLPAVVVLEPDYGATQASEFEAAVRAELSGRAELVVHLWPLNDD
jgi:hypothetical protein